MNIPARNTAHKSNRKKPAQSCTVSQTRTSTGSILIEGVLGIIMVIFGLLVCAIFLLDVVAIVHFKQKIGIISNAAVTKAARQNPGAFHTKLQKATIAAQKEDMRIFVDESLKSLGLPPAQAFEMDTDKSRAETIHITFRIDNLKVPIPIPGIFPEKVSMSETVSTVLPCKVPPSNLSFRVFAFPAGIEQDFRLPSYSNLKPAAGTPSANFVFDDLAPQI